MSESTLPPHILQQLEQLTIELNEGDLTLQGYEKKKSKLLSPFNTHQDTTIKPATRKKSSGFLSNYDQLAKAMSSPRSSTFITRPNQDTHVPGHIPNTSGLDSPYHDYFDSSEYMKTETVSVPSHMAPATLITASDFSMSFIKNRTELEPHSSSNNPLSLSNGSFSQPPHQILLPPAPADLQALHLEDSVSEEEEEEEHVDYSLQSSARPSMTQLAELKGLNDDDFDYTNPETMPPKHRPLHVTVQHETIESPFVQKPRFLENHDGSPMDHLLENVEDLIAQQALPLARPVMQVKTVGSSIAEILKTKSETSEKTCILQVVDHKGRPSQTITYGKLYAKAIRVATLLTEKSHLPPKSPIALVYRPSELIDFSIALFGCFYAGMKAVPIVTSSKNMAKDVLEMNQMIHELGITLALTTDATLKIISKEYVAITGQGPPRIEWWKPNDFGSSKKQPPLQNQVLPHDVAYIDIFRSRQGSLQGVEMTHHVVLEQCLLAKHSHSISQEDVFLNLLEPRHQFGLVMGLLFSVCHGTLLNQLSETGKDYSLAVLKSIERNKVTRLVANDAYLLDIITPLMSLEKPATTGNLSSLKTVFIETMSPCFYFYRDVLHTLEAWQLVPRPQGKDILVPCLTVPELGGLVISWKDNLIHGALHVSRPLRILIDNQCLRSNKIRIMGHSEDGNAVSDMFLSMQESDSANPVIKLMEMGYIASQMEIAIVDPETRGLLPRNQVGEIWVRSMGVLPQEFISLDKTATLPQTESPLLFETHFQGSESGIPTNDVTKKAKAVPLQGAPFFKTGLLGFLIEEGSFPGLQVQTPRLFVVSTTSERIKQINTMDFKSPYHPRHSTDATPTTRLLETSRYDFYYTNLMMESILSTFHHIVVCDFIFYPLLGDSLPVLLIETKQEGSLLKGMCEKVYNLVLQFYGLQLFSICCCTPSTLPRLASPTHSVLTDFRFDRLISQLGFINEKETILQTRKEWLHTRKCQDMYIQGTLPLSFVWMSYYEMSSKPTVSMTGADNSLCQIWGSTSPTPVMDAVSPMDVSLFPTICHLLIWRCESNPDTKVFSCLDSKGRETASLSYRKLSEKATSLAQHLVLKKNMRPNDYVIVMLGHGLEYIITLFACFYSGIIPIPVAPIDSTRLHEDLVLLKTIMDRFQVKKIVLNEASEEVLKSRQSQGFLLPTKDESRLDFMNPQRITKHAKHAMSLNDGLFSIWAQHVQPSHKKALVQVFVSPDGQPTFVELYHKTLLEQCRIQSEHCSINSNTPLLSCVKSYNGIGFLHSVVLGVYQSTCSVIIPPFDYFLNPLVWFETVHKHQVTCAYMTYPMLEHAMNAMQPSDYRSFSLSHVQSLLVSTPHRIPIATRKYKMNEYLLLDKKINALFKGNRLDMHAISPTYSTLVNPMISARTRMSMASVTLQLDTMALQQHRLHVLSCHLVDSHSTQPMKLIGTPCTSVLVEDSGIIVNNVVVAIVNPKTGQLCSPDEYGEIWVSSKGNMDNLYSIESKSAISMETSLPGLDPKLKFVKTGDYGFLWPIPLKTDSQEEHASDTHISHPNVELPECIENTWETLVKGKKDYQMALFVLASLQDAIHIGPFTYFPQDIEETIDQSHPNIVPEASVVFHHQNDIIAAIEVKNEQHIQTCIPCVVHAVLKKHHLLITRLVFVPSDKLPKSRLYEKQRETVKQEYLKNTLQPNEYLIITGLGIPDLRLAKKALVWPLQRCTRFSISPVNYTLSLQAMSIEKLEFTLPAVFTIGPRDLPDCLEKFARLLSDNTRGTQHVQEIVRGVIEGETRVIAAGLTMEEIFKERKYFKENVIRSVQAELDQFGLFIYNANVKQLEDTQGSEYFVYLRMKSHEGAVNQAKVDVAEAKYRGDVGEKQRQGLTRQENARIEAETVVFENQQKKQILQAQATLNTQQVEFDKQVVLAKIEAEKAAAIREAELQKNVEIRRAQVEEEKLRADTYTQAKVSAESTIVDADAALYKAQKEADAKLYKEQKSAEGIKMVYEAQSEGLLKLSAAFHGDASSMLQYLMLEKSVFTDLAKANAEALKGLNPKISVWNTGNSSDSDTYKPLRDLAQAFPPLLSTIKEQTGISPPGWLANLSTENTTS